MQKPFWISLFLLVTGRVSAQSISYNQYNAVLAEINPAFIVNLESNYVTLAGRLQWPGYGAGARMGTFAFNKSSDRINSCLGFTAHHLEYNNGGLTRYRVGLQYAWKVVFLDRFFLDLGANLSLNREIITTPVFFDGFDPKHEGYAHLLSSAENRTLNTDYGFILHPFERFAKWYAGFSVRNVVVHKMGDPNNLGQLPVYALQSMYSMPITRKMNVYTYFSFEHHGKKQNTDWEQTVVKPFNVLLLQANFTYEEQLSFGCGYKYFTSRYGLLCYRATYTQRYLTLGLSYDAKPYIQNDRIHAFSSYEMFLKYRLHYKS